MAPTVSVIIPAYNAEAYLAEAVDSVLAQTLPEVETIVVDDGSTDRTEEILASYRDAIRVIRQPNQGQAIARNTGCREARGDWLAFLDADDVWFPEKLATQLAAITDEVISHTNSYFFGAHLDEDILKTDVTPQAGGRVFEALLLDNMITTSSVLLRKDVFETTSGFRAEYTSIEDWALWLEICHQHELNYVAEPLMRYRLHPLSTSINVRRTLPIHKRLLDEVFAKDGVAHAHRNLRSAAYANSLEVHAFNAMQAQQRGFALRCMAKALTYRPLWPRGWRQLARILVSAVRRDG